MRLTEFSEFSYGYAITDNLINSSNLPEIKGAPVFPSLYEEGRKGGGYDVEIPKRGAPLFLQFKIPQVVSRATKLIPPGFATPYYRMHLRQTSHSLQHWNLLVHEESGRLVYYVAPLFHTTAELNEAFDKTEVPRQSIFVRPSQIGPLDAQPHYVAYHPQRTVAWLYSEPQQIEGAITSDKFFADVQHAITTAEPSRDVGEYLATLANDMIISMTKAALRAEEEVRQRPHITQEPLSPTWESGYQESPQVRAERVEAEVRNRYRLALERLGPIHAAGYLARFYFDCELIIMGAD